MDAELSAEDRRIADINAKITRYRSRLEAAAGNAHEEDCLNLQIEIANCEIDLLNPNISEAERISIRRNVDSRSAELTALRATSTALTAGYCNYFHQ